MDLTNLYYIAEHCVYVSGSSFAFFRDEISRVDATPPEFSFGLAVIFGTNEMPITHI